VCSWKPGTAEKVKMGQTSSSFAVVLINKIGRIEKSQHELLEDLLTSKY
jgi:hypothetical protein